MKLPSNFDGDAFCERGEHLAIEVRAAELARLAQECAGQGDIGALSVTCDGSRVERSALPDYAGFPLLEVDVHGKLAVNCVRCLTATEVSIDLHRRFVLFASEADADNALNEHDEFDAVTGGRHMDLEALVEDEVMMALPEYPAHDACPVGALKALQAYLPADEAPEAESEVARNPFDALRALKRH